MVSISEPFIRRPVGTTLLAIGLFGARVSPAYRDFFIDRRVDLWAGEVVPAGR